MLPASRFPWIGLKTRVTWFGLRGIPEESVRSCMMKGVFNSPWKYAAETSTPSIMSSCAANFASNMWMVSCRATGAYRAPGWKSRYATCLSPRRQRRALNSTGTSVPVFSLMLKSHMYVKCCIPCSKGMISHVSLSSKAAYSRSVASAHLRSEHATSNLFGT